MISAGKASKQQFNALRRRVDFLLSRNFFSIEDIQNLSKRKAIQTLKLISAIEGSKIKKSEAVELWEFICGISKHTVVNKATEAVVSLFEFVSTLARVVVSTIKEWIATVINFIFNFRLMRKRVLRI